jgi:hydrogenase nickel incorporation protein HypA/HybF
MHEFGVMTYLLDAVAEKAQELDATRVIAINIVVGERSCIVSDSLEFYFQMLAEGTVAEGAALNTRRVPTQFRCGDCNTTYEPADYDFRCPDCGEVGLITDEGSELLIESILIERT